MVWVWWCKGVDKSVKMQNKQTTTKKETIKPQTVKSEWLNLHCLLVGVSLVFESCSQISINMLQTNTQPARVHIRCRVLRWQSAERKLLVFHANEGKSLGWFPSEAPVAIFSTLSVTEEPVWHQQPRHVQSHQSLLWMTVNFYHIKY